MATGNLAKEVFLTPPLSIAGCALWLDAAQESGGNNSSVTLIPDRSGNGVNLTSSATLSTNFLNGNPVYNLGTNVPRNSSFTWNSYFTQFVVVKCAVGNWLVDLLNVSNSYIYYTYTGNWNLLDINPFLPNDSVIGQGTSVLTSTPGGVTAWAIFCIGYSGGTTAVNYTINGTVRSTTTSTATSQTNQTGSFYINGNFSSSFDTSYCAELIHYNSVLTTTQRQQVEGYLAWKWGLQSSLPGIHPYASAPPYQIIKIPIKATSSSYFFPTAISGCSMWLDAADTSTLTISGSNVSSWRDKSGNNNNATQPTLANQPTTGTLLNGLNVLDFTGTQPYFSFPTISYTNITVFTIFRNTTLRAYCSPLFIGPFFFFFTDGAGNSLYGTGRLGINGEGTISQAAAGITTTKYLLYSLNLTVGATDVVNFYINGTNAANFNGSASGGRSYYQVGSTDPVGATTGFTAEIIVYNGVLNNSQRQQVEGYLAWKWGLQSSLPPTHPNYTIPYVPFPFPTSIPKASIGVWSPLRISGSQLWLDAADSSRFTYSSGSNISIWADKSPGGNNLTTQTGTPTYTTDGGLNVVNFPSGAILQTSFTFTITTSSAFFVVAKLTSISTGYPMILTLLDNNSGDYSIRYSGSVVNFGNSDDIGNGNYYTNGAPNANASFLNQYVIIDTTTATRPASSRISLSGTFNGRYFIGNISEVIVYPGGVTSSQRQQTEGYLAWKWGLQSSLPGGHPYINFPPSP